MNAAAPAADRSAPFAALSFACSAWAALGTYPFVESSVARAMVFWSAPALGLGALLLAALGHRARPEVAAQAGLVARGASALWAAILAGAQG